jgi:hypothetical protein
VRASELIDELLRFDPDSEVTVGERVVRDIGRRERSGTVNPTLHLADEPAYDGLKALDSLRGMVRRHFICSDPTADAWALKHWEVARATLQRYRTTLENIGFAREFPGDEVAALEGCRRTAREAIGR